MEPKYNPDLDTVLLVKLPGCPHCVEYEKRWPEIKKHLEIIGKVNTDSITKPIPLGPYKDVEGKVGINYPVMAWISSKSLNRAKLNNGGMLDVIPFQTKIVREDKTIESVPMDVPNLLNWIETINKMIKNNNQKSSLRKEAESDKPKIQESPENNSSNISVFIDKCSRNRPPKKYIYQ